MMLFKCKQTKFLLLLVVAAWLPPSTAKTTNYVRKMTRGQKERRLYGERVVRSGRGGVAGQTKGFAEVVPMRDRADPNSPLQTETPETALPATEPTAAPSPRTTTIVIPAPTPAVPPAVPSSQPTAPEPSITPSVAPSPPLSSAEPSSTPTVAPSVAPSPQPSSAEPTVALTGEPSDSPTPDPTDPPLLEPTFVMGRLNKVENGLTLSEGLSSAIIAESGQPVIFESDGSFSDINFHNRPSAGATFLDTRGNNPGGWVYVSGIDAAEGGVGSLTFNAAGEVINYELILEGTSANSNGGRTPWETFVTGEQDIATLNGDALQVHPFGDREAEVLTLTEDGGAWEGFTYDIRDPESPYFYMSESFVFGAVRRFLPSVINETDPWSMLHGPGTIEYLILSPNADDPRGGEFSWTNEIMIARANAARNYPEAHGIDISGSTLAFVIQGERQLFQLDLDSGVYKRTSTNTGLLEGEPIEIHYVTGTNDQTLLYITEANGQRSGVHARTDAGVVYTVFEGFYQTLTAGFALSPDGKHMYTSFKRDGLVFDITRDDGLSFFDPALAYEVSP